MCMCVSHSCLLAHLCTRMHKHQLTDILTNFDALMMTLLLLPISPYYWYHFEVIQLGRNQQNTGPKSSFKTLNLRQTGNI